jgi:predicted nuclease of predicted toxin-antitoxin system
MRLKLDENFDVRLAPQLAVEGFDVDTVRAEGLSGSKDETIYDTCKATGRVLVTLDLDFSNPLRFPAAGTEGIVVVRPSRAVLPAIQATLWGALAALKTGSVRGNLWIVEPGRIREYSPDAGAGAGP